MVNVPPISRGALTDAKKKEKERRKKKRTEENAKIWKMPQRMTNVYKLRGPRSHI